MKVCRAWFAMNNYLPHRVWELYNCRFLKSPPSTYPRPPFRWGAPFLRVSFTVNHVEGGRQFSCNISGRDWRQNFSQTTLIVSIIHVWTSRFQWRHTTIFLWFSFSPSSSLSLGWKRRFQEEDCYFILIDSTKRKEAPLSSNHRTNWWRASLTLSSICAHLFLWLALNSSSFTAAVRKWETHTEKQER